MACDKPHTDLTFTFLYNITQNTSIISVAPSLQMGSYGANFMDIAPSGGQYCYQDDLFTGSMASFAKPFLSGTYRWPDYFSLEIRFAFHFWHFLVWFLILIIYCVFCSFYYPHFKNIKLSYTYCFIWSFLRFYSTHYFKPTFVFLK